ncbi:MAG: histidinol-phosphate transaminase [Halobacteria archaeon]
MDLLRDLSEFTEYVPGRGVEEVAEQHDLSIEEVVKLSSNENPLGPSPEVKKAVEREVDGINIYPTKLHTETKRRVAEYHDVPAGNLVLGSGGDGVFDSIGRAVIEEGDAVLTPKPGFSYYGMSARNLGGRENSYKIKDDSGFSYGVGSIIDTYDGEKITYVTAPNNPTGTDLSRSDVTELADETDGLLVVDEAYVEFSGRDSCIDIPLEREDVAVVRTFSKAFGMAGLRVGYGVLPDELATAYRKVVTPFSVGSLSLYAAQAAVEDEEHLNDSVRVARWSREYMTDNLEPEVYDSRANFVLVDVSPSNAGDFSSELEKKGIVVRDTTSFGLPSCIRISAGREEETREAVDAVNDVYREVK